VLVFHDRKFERQALGVGQEMIGEKTGTVMGARYAPFASRMVMIAGLSQAPMGRSRADSMTIAPAARSIGYTGAR
jgi:hypothetical protein